MGLPEGAQLAEAEEEGCIFWGCRIGMFFIVKINDMMYRHFLWLCHRKWLMLFSLKFHRDNRQNALALYSAKRKNEEKRLYFHRAIEMKQPHTMTEPFLFTLSHPEKYVKMASYRVSTRSMFLGNTMIFLRKHIVYPYSPAAFRKVGAKRHVRACRFI